MEINRFRGDNKPFRFTLYSDKKNNIRLPLNGLIFRLTVNSEKDPETTDKQIFTLNGINVDDAEGILEFRPTRDNMNIPKGVYYYDIQVTNITGDYDDTIQKDKFIIGQDISK